MSSEGRTIGKAGAAEILKALAQGSMTFTELAKHLNVHTLRRRLKEFLQEGLVLRRVLADRRVQYQLTPRGFELAAKVLGAEKAMALSLEKLMGEWYGAFIREWNAYWAIRDQIIQRYRGRFVAVCGGEVCAIADTMLEAAREAERRMGPKPMYIAKVGEELVPYVVRSPKVEAGQKK